MNQKKFLEFSLEIKNKPKNSFLDVEKYLQCLFTLYNPYVNNIQNVSKILNTEETPLLYYPAGPLSDPLLTYYFTAKQISNYFLVPKNDQLIPDFIIDFKKLNIKEIDNNAALVIKIYGIPQINNPAHRKYPLKENMYFQFFSHQNFLDKKNKYFDEKNKAFFIKEYQDNTISIFVNFLLLQFYSQDTIIKKYLHIINKPSMKIYYSYEEYNFNVKGTEHSIYKDYLIYDSNQKLNEVFKERSWLFLDEEFDLTS